MKYLIPLVLLAGCAQPPEQPDLNTYGALQPLCVLFCRQIFTLTEGDGGAGDTTLVPITSANTESSNTLGAAP